MLAQLRSTLLNVAFVCSPCWALLLHVAHCLKPVKVLPKSCQDFFCLVRLHGLHERERLKTVRAEQCDAFLRFSSSIFISHYNWANDNNAVWFCKDFWMNITVTVHSTLPNMLWSFKHPQPTLHNVYPTMLGDVVPTCCAHLHRYLVF